MAADCEHGGFPCLRNLLGAPASIRQLLALAPVAVVKHFTIWQLVTYLFLHGGVWHLIFNMLTLWMFGPRWSATGAPGDS